MELADVTSIQIDRNDGLSSSTAVKGPCKVATTANITLSGEQTIDGVALVTGDRVLVKDQTNAVDNGIWKVSTGVWSRAKDFSSNRDVKTGTVVNISGGSTNSGWWEVTTADPIAIGTTSIAFAQRLQPYDADLAAIAALSTQVYGRSLLTLASSTALAAEVDPFFLTQAEGDAAYQPLDADLSAIAALSTQAHGRSLLTAASAADVRLSEVIPTFVTLAQLQALDTSKDKLAYCTDIGYEGWFKWATGDQSSRTVAQSVTSTVVNSGTGVVTAAGHLLSTASGFVVTTAVNGLSLNTAYYAIKVDDNNFKIASTPENAIAGTAVTLTGTTNFTLKQLVDPMQDVYVIPTGGQLDGTGGAWTKAQASRSLGIGRARFQRFNDRLFVGLGATSWMGDHSGTLSSTGAGSWLIDEYGTGGTSPMSYLLVQAALAAVPPPISGHPSSGVLGAVRSKDGTDNGSYIGVAGFASGHATGGASQVRAGYFEAVKRSGYSGTAQTFELEITNLDSTPTTIFQPYASFVQNRSMGILMATGGGSSTNPSPFDADIAMVLDTNGAKFRTGITFTQNALTKDASTNYQHAVLLPSKARVEWYSSDATGNYGFTIHSEVSTLANSQYWIAIDGEFRMFNQAGGIYARFQTNTAAGGNYLYFQASNAGASPNISAQGGDTNLDLNLTPKGTGAVRTAAALLSSSATGGIGYATGAGGTVTQATSRTTGVTLNKVSGAITMFTAAGSATPASFTVTNSTVAATDTVILNIKSGATNTYFYFVTAVAAGSFVVTFWTTGGTASDTPVINFNVIKGVSA